MEELQKLADMERECPECRGQGKIYQGIEFTSRVGDENPERYERCPDCKGTGQVARSTPGGGAGGHQEPGVAGGLRVPSARRICGCF